MTQTTEKTAIAPDGATLEVVAATLDEAMGRLAGLEPTARRIMTDALDSLDALHREALTTIVRTLKADPRGKQLLFALVDDPGVRMVLAMHKIIRPDPETQARQVIDGLRPGLQSHGGDVELDGIRGGVAYVRLQGACNGCSMASVTMREGVEKALVEAVPGVNAVEVLPNDPTPTLIPLSDIGVGAPAATGEAGATDPGDLRAAGWCPTFAAGEIGVGSLRSITVHPVGASAVEAIVVNAAGRLAAYVNACAHQGLPLDDAEVDADEGTITCPWHGFCYDAATGECTSMPGAQLAQLPLRIEDGRVWVRAVGG